MRPGGGLNCLGLPFAVLVSFDDGALNAIFQECLQLLEVLHPDVHIPW